MTLTVSEAYRDAVAGEIRAWMGRRGLNQSDLARELGVPRMWVSRRLSGRHLIDVADLVRLATVLECSVDALLPPLDVIRAGVYAELMDQIEPNGLTSQEHPQLLAAA